MQKKECVLSKKTRDGLPQLLNENLNPVSKSVWQVVALSNDEPRSKRLQNCKDQSKTNWKAAPISE